MRQPGPDGAAAFSTTRPNAQTVANGAGAIPPLQRLAVLRGSNTCGLRNPGPKRPPAFLGAATAVARSIQPSQQTL